MVSRPGKPLLIACAAITGVLGIFFLLVSPVGASLLDTFLVYSPVIYRPAIPTPTPTPVPKIEVLKNDTNYIVNGDLHVVGDIYNDIGKNADNVTVPIQLLDRDNKVIATQEPLVFLSNFAPTDTTCYHAAFLNTTTGWAKYDVLPPKYGLASGSPPKLSLSGVFGAYDTQTKFYSITGSITNEDDSTVYLPKAIGTLYDKNGDVLGCMAAYIDGTSLYLQPDRTASFKITFDERDYKDVTRFRLQADGFIP